MRHNESSPFEQDPEYSAEPVDEAASGQQAISFPFGYCSNVHAGTSFRQAKENLCAFSAKVRELVCPDSKLPVGLWLPGMASEQILESEGLGDADSFGSWLAEQGFEAYTINGFPQGDFHQEIVKHDVYRPTWLDAERAEYTCRLAQILTKLIPGTVGSISTLPLGWPHTKWTTEHFQQAAAKLVEVAQFLDKLAQQTGKEIVLAIEPEPGCVLNTASEIVEFFQRFLFNGPDADLARRYLSVCHDICHSGVMFEPQEQALAAYVDAGIRVGKVQVSSAVHVPWKSATGKHKLQQQILEQLRTFDEPKFLHQATRCDENGLLAELADDLGDALNGWLEDGRYPERDWRVHFHVPIFVEHFGVLTTTQPDIMHATRFLESNRHTSIADADWFTGHYEVETYAWTVLPPSIAEPDLAQGIARELQYFEEVLRTYRTESGT